MWLGWLGIGAADAFTTRVHVVLANEIYAALAASDGHSVALLGSDQRVELDPVDADAILSHPLEFRAGAIDPDNFVFPAMTDQTHALGLRPYDQCRDLYGLATDDAERAYALGCLLHGATDAVAHHYVNWLTGETFTLTPISAGREESYDNVVRHIVAEAMVQDAALALAPERFDAAHMAHAIPDGFVVRAMVSTDSPVWQRMALHALPELESARSDAPGAALAEVVASLDLGPSELVVLLPRYIEILHVEAGQFGELLDGYVAGLQDPGTPDGAQLGVTAGDDGLLGTPDDLTACDVSCPQLFVGYFVAVALLQPGDDGEPRWTQLTDRFTDDLDALPAAYVASVGNVSAQLTGPLAPGDDPVGLDPVAIAAAMGPLYGWLDETFAIDEPTVELVAPPWLLELRDALAALGVDIDLGELVDAVLEPVVEPIRRAIEEDLLEAVLTEVDAVVGAYDSDRDVVEAEYRERLAAAAPAGLDGTALDHLFDSGLWFASFDLAAVALAAPEAVLPIGDDWDGVGGASFDASHTLAWTQAGVCEDVAAAAFPLGHDVRGLLSVAVDGERFAAAAVDDAPVECHDGALDAFTSGPSAESCALTDLDGLRDELRGSLSRGFPPSAVGLAIPCELTVPGLRSADVPPPPARDGGCGCGSSGPGGGIALILAALALRRRAAVAAAAGCAASEEGDGPASAEPVGATAGADLRDALGATTWHGDVELEFRADVGLWVETARPFGPSVARTARELVFTGPDQLTTVVTTPEGWPADPDEGRAESWTVTVAEGALELVDAEGGARTFAPGLLPAPSVGTYAVASGFEAGSLVDDALCDATFAPDHATLFGFARGETESLPDTVATDAAAGVPLDGWPAGAPTLHDVPGFAASAVPLREDFVVRYLGTLDFPGGSLGVRERDDSVDGGAWVFVGDQVGHGEDFALEVHSLLAPDGTADAPRIELPRGDVPIEVIVARCSGDAERVDVEFDLGDGFAALPLEAVRPDTSAFGPAL